MQVLTLRKFLTFPFGVLHGASVLVPTHLNIVANCDRFVKDLEKDWFNENSMKIQGTNNIVFHKSPNSCQVGNEPLDFCFFHHRWFERTKIKNLFFHK